MPQQEITRRLAEYIVNELASRKPDALPADDFPIIESGLIDSLGLFKLIAYIEEHYPVSIAPEEILFENFATLAQIAALIEGKTGKGA